MRIPWSADVVGWLRLTVLVLSGGPAPRALAGTLSGLSNTKVKREMGNLKGVFTHLRKIWTHTNSRGYFNLGETCTWRRWRRSAVCGWREVRCGGGRDECSGWERLIFGRWGLLSVRARCGHHHNSILLALFLKNHWFIYGQITGPYQYVYCIVWWVPSSISLLRVV